MNTNIKILIGAFIFYIAENMYFGWNQRPLSSGEGFCDMIVLFLMLTAVLWRDTNAKI
jgi:hypothetical protein